jgi:hypothetical protein
MEPRTGDLWAARTLTEPKTSLCPAGRRSDPSAPELADFPGLSIRRRLRGGLDRCGSREGLVKEICRCRGGISSCLWSWVERRRTQNRTVQKMVHRLGKYWNGIETDFVYQGSWTSAGDSEYVQYVSACE